MNVRNNVTYSKILLIVCLSFGLDVFAFNDKVNNDSTFQREFIRRNLKVYRTSLKSADYYTAIIALNYVVVDADSGRYQDSLAFLYFMVKNYYQAKYWSQEVLKRDKDNLGMLEIEAACLKNSNQYIEAIDKYEKLMQITNSPFMALNLIELQLQIKRLYECVLSTDLVETLKFNSDMKYEYSYNGISYSSSLKSAFYNYRGLAYFELNNYESALKAFQMSLECDSTFILAKDNLKILKAKMKGGSNGSKSNLSKGKNK